MCNDKKEFLDSIIKCKLCYIVLKTDCKIHNNELHNIYNEETLNRINNICKQINSLNTELYELNKNYINN